MTDIRTLLHEAAPGPSAPLDVEVLVVRAAHRPWHRRVVVWLAGLVAVVGVGVPLRSVLVPSTDGDVDRVQTVRPAPAPSWRVERLNDLTVHAEFVHGVAVWDDRVAYLPDGTSVVVADVRTGETHTVARPVLTKGTFSSVAGSGDWVVFLESIGATDDELVPGDGGRLWRVAAVDLRTGREREVMRRSQPIPYPLTPAPVIDGPWVVWEQEQETGPRTASKEVVVHDLRSWTTRVVRDLDPSGVDVDDGTMFMGAPSDGDRFDVFAMAADGSGERRQVTQVGNVCCINSGDGVVTWQYQPPRDLTVPSDGSSELWAQLVGAAGRPIHVGDGFGPVPGDGFVLWSARGNDRSLVLRGLDPADPVVWIPTEEYIPAWQWDASGDRIAWLTDPVDRPGPSTLHVARVVHP